MSRLPPSSLLLVLAWDAADPALRRGGLRPAPPLPLLRALARLRPLLAVLPQLPGGAEVADLAAEVEAEALLEVPAAPAPASPELQLEEDYPAPVPALALPAASLPGPAPRLPAPPAPGVLLLAPPRLLPAPFASRVLGVAEGLPTAVRAEVAAGLIGEATAKPAAALALRIPLAQRPPDGTSWLAPAAPYLGSSARSNGPLSITIFQPEEPKKESGDGSNSLDFHPAFQAFRQIAVDDSGGPIDLPTGSSALFSEEVSEKVSVPNSDLEADAAPEPGPAEAAALGTAEAPEQAPARSYPNAAHATLSHGLQALHRPETPAVAPPENTAGALPETPFALADDLHYRLIQYARFAVPLVAAQHQTFGLVYAADWPTWLAALEMRYRYRCPLVLHLSALAADAAAPAERGWLLELERYALRRAHTVLVATEGLRQHVLAAYPALPPGRVVVTDVTDAAALALALGKIG